ncbi:NAD-binding protein [Kibdelosporangium phytohabitans]|uniref:NAD-binding protein n=1 Tax=Kibdelosporangium phytohabitans TaxID=860235 RepID=UPI002FF4ACB9
MVAVSEGFALAERLGLSHQALFDVAATSSGQCWSLTTNCPVPGSVPSSPANRGYQGGFAGALMLEDLRLAQAAAAAHGLGTTLGKAAEQTDEQFVAEGGGKLDFSGVFTAIRKDTP